MPERIFVVEDELHSEWRGQYNSFDEALNKIKELAISPFTSSVNKPPCEEWQTCGRQYTIVEYDTTVAPWKEIKRIAVMEMTKDQVIWKYNV